MTMSHISISITEGAPSGGLVKSQLRVVQPPNVTPTAPANTLIAAPATLLLRSARVRGRNLRGAPLRRTLFSRSLKASHATDDVDDEAEALRSRRPPARAVDSFGCSPLMQPIRPG